MIYQEIKEDKLRASATVCGLHKHLNGDCTITIIVAGVEVTFKTTAKVIDDLEYTPIGLECDLYIVDGVVISARIIV